MLNCTKIKSRIQTQDFADTLVSLFYLYQYLLKNLTCYTFSLKFCFLLRTTAYFSFMSQVHWALSGNLCSTESFRALFLQGCVLIGTRHTGLQLCTEKDHELHRLKWLTPERTDAHGQNRLQEHLGSLSSPVMIPAKALLQ